MIGHFPTVIRCLSAEADAEEWMSRLVHEEAAATDAIRPSAEHNLVMLRHHLNQAMFLAEKLKMNVTRGDLCQILKWLDA